MNERTDQQVQSRFSSHSVAMSDRKKAELSGVTKVESSNAGEIILITCLGRLTITGSELKIIKYDTADGRLELSGNVDGMRYAQPKVPLLKRIFK